MACNGYNHPANCPCAFKGGRLVSSHLPKWRPWKPSIARRRTSGPNATCPTCRAPVFFVAMRNGGGAYFDTFGPPWTKHPCTDASKKYSPFNADGRPKLKSRPSEYERDGWLPLFVRYVEILTIGALLHAVTLDDPTVLHFGLVTNIEVDIEQPIYFRRIDSIGNHAEFNFFPKGSPAPLYLDAVLPCLTEIELRIHMKRI